jgi:hypothetical protein
MSTETATPTVPGLPKAMTGPAGALAGEVGR